ncbi:hypothetical protein GGX14DRAFT_606053 [Mycena pura]|uniref:Uncharacterized protein n=1 Tax=Mycena pura TaxID=153505 RepID=A0AAD6UMA7_9AGAR|nr:hypothetical protein GGX14DRAFT_606053 [Mycena pura]
MTSPNYTVKQDSGKLELTLGWATRGDPSCSNIPLVPSRSTPYAFGHPLDLAARTVIAFRRPREATDGLVHTAPAQQLHRSTVLTAMHPPRCLQPPHTLPVFGCLRTAKQRYKARRARGPTLPALARSAPDAHTHSRLVRSPALSNMFSNRSPPGAPPVPPVPPAAVSVFLCLVAATPTHPTPDDVGVGSAPPGVPAAHRRQLECCTAAAAADPPGARRSCVCV